MCQQRANRCRRLAPSREIGRTKESRSCCRRAPTLVVAQWTHLGGAESIEILTYQRWYDILSALPGFLRKPPPSVPARPRSPPPARQAGWWYQQAALRPSRSTQTPLHTSCWRSNCGFVSDVRGCGVWSVVGSAFAPPLAGTGDSLLLGAWIVHQRH